MLRRLLVLRPEAKSSMFLTGTSTCAKVPLSSLYEILHRRKVVLARAPSAKRKMLT